jgi:hypothetical protein
VSTSRRKVSKFVVHITDNRSGHRLPSSAMKDLIEAKMSAPAPDRLYDNNMRNKFILLDCFQGDHPIYTGYFKSAKYNHRPPLISKLTLEERENPKLMEEGEAEKTHFGMLFRRDDIILVLESKGGGIRIGPLVRYLDLWVPENTRIDYELFAGPEFLSRLRDMARATEIDVFTSTEIASQTFNIDRPLPDVRDEVMITFKAKKRRSIRTPAQYLYRQLFQTNSVATRIRVYGKSENRDDVIIDTEKLTDSEYLELELDGNGQVLTESAFQKLTAMLELLE